MESVSPIEAQSAEQCEVLRTRLIESRQETADAIARFKDFRSAVRKTVIENIKDSTICRAGANEALESWGEDPYQPRYTVRARIDVTVTLDADDEDEARHAVYNALSVSADELEYYVDDTTVTYIQEIDD